MKKDIVERLADRLNKRMEERKCPIHFTSIVSDKPTEVIVRGTCEINGIELSALMPCPKELAWAPEMVTDIARGFITDYKRKVEMLS